MAQGILSVTSLCSERGLQIFLQVSPPFPFFFFSVKNDIAVMVAALCSLKSKLSAAEGSADVCLRFLKNGKIPTQCPVDAPRQRPAGVALCPAPLWVTLARCSLFPRAVAVGRCSVCSTGSRRQGCLCPQHEGLLEGGRGAVGRTVTPKGCQAGELCSVVGLSTYLLTFSMLLGLCFVAGLSR